MTLNSVELREAGEKATHLAKGLRLLAKYLADVRDDCDSSSAELRFAWDWEMLREAIYPNSPGSVFSGVLWYGLECLEASSAVRDDWKILMPEGTRKELLGFLTGLLSSYKKHNRRLSNAAPTLNEVYLSLGSGNAFVERPEWKQILLQISSLMRIDQAIDRLLLILQRYARPTPAGNEKSLSGKVVYFSERLGRARSRPQDHQRNEADALN